MNVSPALHTRPIVEAQGFVRYTSGQFVAAPALSRRQEKARIVAVGTPPGAHFEQGEHELLAMHKDYGCLALWCVTPERAHPFVFLPRLVKGLIPSAQLIYCRTVDDFVRFARPLGGYLVASGRPFVIADSNGSIPGLVGVYLDGRSPKYFKGPRPPGIGDLAHSEAVMFGL